MQKIYSKVQLIREEVGDKVFTIEKTNDLSVEGFIKMMGLFYSACGFSNNLIVGVCTDSDVPDYHIEIKPHSTEVV